jgi:hypothetical protein
MKPRRNEAWLALALALGACARHEATGTPAAVADSAAVHAIADDQSERLVMPLVPAGAGHIVMGAVAEKRADLLRVAVQVGIEPARAALDLPPPVADPSAVPEQPAAADSDQPQLKPPLPRGAPRLPRGGRGGRVTMDVRVDEHGDVSDVQVVETDADSMTVHAASEAAFAARYHPAMLGPRRVAVWTRQVFEVKREHDSK